MCTFDRHPSSLPTFAICHCESRVSKGGGGGLGAWLADSKPRAPASILGHVKPHLGQWVALFTFHWPKARDWKSELSGAFLHTFDRRKGQEGLCTEVSLILPSLWSCRHAPCWHRRWALAFFARQAVCAVCRRGAGAAGWRSDRAVRCKLCTNLHKLNRAKRDLEAEHGRGRTTLVSTGNTSVR